jgi:uncharacterized protein
MKRGMPQVRAEAAMIDPIDRVPFYHDGMRELQDRFDGRRVADGLEEHRLHFEFWEQDRKLIEEAQFFFIATSYQDNADCSIRSGDPGFVRITGPDTLEYPNTTATTCTAHSAIFTGTRTSGCCSCASTASRFARASEANQRSRTARKRLPRIMARKSSCASKCEIFPNCPRYVPDLMGASAAVPANPFVPRPGYEPPPPEWKSRDHLKDVLSKYDPHRKREGYRAAPA